MSSGSLSGLAISEIESRDCVRQFCCGENSIDGWVKNKAFKFHSRDQSRVFCARFSGNKIAIGVYSLSLGQITAEYLFEQDGNRYRSDPAPLIFINHIGVNRSHHGNGIGRHMMMDALLRAHKVSYHVPIYGIALRSLNEKTTRFYERNGFVRRQQEINPLMILPIWIIRDLLTSDRG